MNESLKTQVGGNHYKDLQIQPAEFYDLITMPVMALMAIKYITRWRKKNGTEDLNKARHCLMIQQELDEPRRTKIKEFIAQFPEQDQKILCDIITGKYDAAIFKLTIIAGTHDDDHHDPESTTD